MSHRQNKRQNLFKPDPSAGQLEIRHHAPGEGYVSQRPCFSPARLCEVSGKVLLKPSWFQTSATNVSRTVSQSLIVFIQWNHCRWFDRGSRVQWCHFTGLTTASRTCCAAMVFGFYIGGMIHAEKFCFSKTHINCRVCVPTTMCNMYLLMYIYITLHVHTNFLQSCKYWLICKHRDCTMATAHSNLTWQT